MKATLNFLLADTETTGLDSTKDRIVELGWTQLEFDPATGEARIFGTDSILVNPGVPIPPIASAVHHITDADVKDAPVLGDAIQRLPLHPGVIISAHNWAFDAGFLTPQLIGDRSAICTCKGARRVWPDAPGHKNQELRYWLNPEGIDAALAKDTHRAGSDAYVTAFILRELLKCATVEELIQWTKEPSLLGICYLKKHKGTPWKNVPHDYLRLVAGQPDMDADIKHTANYWLNNR